MDERIKSIEFIEDTHEYWFVDSAGHHRQLHGVTGAIGKLMGKKFPDTDTVKIATMYGSDVHKEVENYFNRHEYKFNDSELSTKGAQWIIDELRRFTTLAEEDGDKLDMIECEVMVSDFTGTASKVDIVLRTKQNKVWLFDIKTTSTFDRPYCSLQLSVYKKLYTENYGGTVIGMFVLGTKSQRAFRIIEQPATKVETILNMNKPKD